MAGQSEMPVFISLARVMQQRVREFNTQDLSNTAWAFSTTGRWEVSLFAALAEAVTQRVREFHKKIFLVTYWALSRYERLRDVWGCFELSRDTVLAMPLCGGLLLMECEQRGLIQQEISLLRGLEREARKHAADTGFTQAARWTAAMRHAKTKLLDPRWNIGAAPEAIAATGICSWCAWLEQHPLPPSAGS
eukprot:gnl/TRDRNA2_/TRDRNA2_150949_c0_seq3.p1 gnl/TRDRNA2_/TRDRNA2_150949_c0~~gnl/TRDRNA2_/TRDRNA2_150949_c0_seq3.p1  ORF type:complete len:191 (-),score=27.63 gnl/TRDRNA2_/TRDRNA2_150949_c0_seq3:116-688(-)